MPCRYPTTEHATCRRWSIGPGLSEASLDAAHVQLPAPHRRPTQLRKCIIWKANSHVFDVLTVIVPQYFASLSIIMGNTIIKATNPEKANNTGSAIDQYIDRLSVVSNILWNPSAEKKGGSFSRKITIANSEPSQNAGLGPAEHRIRTTDLLGLRWELAKDHKDLL